MYEWVFEKGYADFDSQSECEDFIRWAIDEITNLRGEIAKYQDIKNGE